MKITFLIILIFNFPLEAFGQETLILLPETETEFQALYNYVPTDAELNKVNSISPDEGKVFIVKNKNDLFLHLDNSNSYYTIIGHNESGILYLPSGEKISIKIIEERITSQSKKIFFLSCNASRYTQLPATSLKTNFSKAINISNRIEKEFERYLNRKRSVVPKKSISTLVPDLHNDYCITQTTNNTSLNLDLSRLERIAQRSIYEEEGILILNRALLFLGGGAIVYLTFRED